MTEYFTYFHHARRREYEFSEGLCAIHKRQNTPETCFGFVDTAGNTAIGFEFKYAHSFHEEIAWVLRGGKWGAIDKTGSSVIDFQFDNVQPLFSNGLCSAQLGDRWCVVNRQGEFLYGPTLLEPVVFSESVGWVKTEEHPTSRLVDTQGEVLIDDPKIEPIRMFHSHEGLLCVYCSNKGRCIVIDHSGNVVIDRADDGTTIEGAFPFCDSLAVIYTVHGSGVIDRTGHVCTKYWGSHSYLSPFSQEVVVASFGDDYYFLNKNGQQVFDRTFAEADIFFNGRATVALNIPDPEEDGLFDWREGQINQLGETVLPFDFVTVGAFNDSRVWIRNEYKQAILDENGNTVWEHRDWN